MPIFRRINEKMPCDSGIICVSNHVQVDHKAYTPWVASSATASCLLLSRVMTSIVPDPKMKGIIHDVSFHTHSATCTDHAGQTTAEHADNLS